MNPQIPRTPFALISGSAGWGLVFPDDLHEPGVRVAERGLSFDTPWGRCGDWQLLEIDGSLSADGRKRTVLNVFSHGWPLEEIDHSIHRRVAWVLAEAGVRKVLADSTCGSLNRALEPRDFVIPADVIDLTQTQFSGLGGRFRNLCLGAQLFCPALGATLEDTARRLWPTPGRVYGPATGLVIAHNWGPRFTSRAEAGAYRLLGGDAINQSIAPEATAMREIGVCFASASYVVCYEEGVGATADADLDSIHAELAALSTRISLLAIARAGISDDCGCAAHRIERPETYMPNR